MVQIKLDEAVATKLHDPSGKVLGRFVPHFDPAQWEPVSPPCGDEELERRLNSNAKHYSTAEVLARLRSLEKQ